MSPSWLLEPLREENLSAVTEIERRSYRSPWPREAFLADVTPDPWAHTLVLKDADRPAAGVRGYICFWILQGELAIHNIAVHPDDRRMGAAWRMLEESFSMAWRAGCRYAYLEVRPSNVGAQELYRRWGFIVVGRRKRYYEDSGEDALVMRAEVVGAPFPKPAGEEASSLKGPRNG